MTRLQKNLVPQFFTVPKAQKDGPRMGVHMQEDGVIQFDCLESPQYSPAALPRPGQELPACSSTLRIAMILLVGCQIFESTSSGDSEEREKAPLRPHNKRRQYGQAGYVKSWAQNTSLPTTTSFFRLNSSEGAQGSRAGPT